MGAKAIKIKICGLTRAADIAAVNEARPDYIGFVFAGSKRRVTPQQATVLRHGLAPGIVPVGVFVNAQAEEIARLCRAGVIEAVQLHGDEDEAYIRTLRAYTGAPIIKAVRVGARVPEEALASSADYLLFDKLSERAYGGLGEAFDWSLLAGVGRPFFLAGGITLENVFEAAKSLPHCIDVSSGVETGGVKDGVKIAKIIEKVRSMCYNEQDTGNLRGAARPGENGVHPLHYRW